MGMISLLQQRPMPSHQTKGPGVARGGQDLESLCSIFIFRSKSDFIAK